MPVAAYARALSRRCLCMHARLFMFVYVWVYVWVFAQRTLCHHWCCQTGGTAIIFKCAQNTQNTHRTDTHTHTHTHTYIYIVFSVVAFLDNFPSALLKHENEIDSLGLKDGTADTNSRCQLPWQVSEDNGLGQPNGTVAMSFSSNFLTNICTPLLCFFVWQCVHMCVCERERERERARMFCCVGNDAIWNVCHS